MTAQELAEKLNADADGLEELISDIESITTGAEYMGSAQWEKDAYAEAEASINARKAAMIERLRLAADRIERAMKFAADELNYNPKWCGPNCACKGGQLMRILNGVPQKEGK